MKWKRISGNTAQVVYGECFDRGASYTNWRPGGSGDCLLLLTLAGAGRVGDSARQHRLGPGEAALYSINAEQVYYTDPETGRWKFLWAHFLPPPLWSYGRAWTPLEPGLAHVRVRRASSLRAAAEALREMARRVRQSEPLAVDFALNALERALLWLEREARSTGIAEPDARVRAAADWLTREVARPFDLETTARQAGLSVSRLAHLFREQTGLTPRAYAEEHKMRHAAQLLRLTALPVGEVAASCGYPDPFHFSTRFRRWSKLSPRAFRRKSQVPGGEPAARHGHPLPK